MKSLLLFLTICSGIYAQENLPIIKSSSEKVDIRVGEDYFSKGGWHLNPNAKPDVFSIGSKWNYTAKKVSFITNLDSISFNVKPNTKYDFVILLNENQPCHIQIVTSANPYFMQNKVLISIIIFLLIIGLILYRKRNSLPLKTMISLGLIIPILFWAITIIAGNIHGNYTHYKNVISELGAIGTKSEIFTSSAFVLLSILCFLFSIGFYISSKKLKLSIIPSILTFSMPIAILWAGIFPLKNEFHNFTGPLPLFMILGAILTFVLWRKNERLKKLRILSLISFIIMLFLFLRFIEPFGYEFEGLVQRFFYLGWSIWYISISAFLLKRLNSHHS